MTGLVQLGVSKLAGSPSRLNENRIAINGDKRVRTLLSYLKSQME
jgi:hypothetical protein